MKKPLISVLRWLLWKVEKQPSYDFTTGTANTTYHYWPGQDSSNRNGNIYR
jgi:hypothetical protein